MPVHPRISSSCLTQVNGWTACVRACPCVLVCVCARMRTARRGGVVRASHCVRDAKPVSAPCSRGNPSPYREREPFPDSEPRTEPLHSLAPRAPGAQVPVRHGGILRRPRLRVGLGLGLISSESPTPSRSWHCGTNWARGELALHRERNERHRRLKKPAGVVRGRVRS